MKLRSTGRKPLVPTRYDIEKIQDHKVKNAFILQLKNKFQALTDNSDMIPAETTEVNSKWDQIKTIYETTSENCLGFKHGEKMKKWITPDEDIEVGDLKDGHIDERNVNINDDVTNDIDKRFMNDSDERDVTDIDERDVNDIDEHYVDDSQYIDILKLSSSN
ncbi:unnamed protein product [Mytilus coruscus]|uniref:Uncharacterized protein n=1 Tax=Mytilus coruscus TaxID=42192 RepID=A0A6J8CWN6_MYTCO|nr:unnamed protein product [Mytilus coruscus]